MPGSEGVNILIVIVGPTASGKTDLAVQLAREFGTEVISADSRQFYREMTAGTAKPSLEELGGVRYHLIDFLSIHDAYTAGQYEHDALACISEIFQKQRTAILAGGSGLFVKAVCEGFGEMPPSDGEVRKKLSTIFQTKGLQPLLEHLKTVDPFYYDCVDRRNPQRVMRALEVFETTGKPYSSFRKKNKKERPFRIVKIGLDMPREELYRRIDSRVDSMIENGLFEEAESLVSYRYLNALQTVGYTEIFDFLEGKYDREECVRLLKRNTRRYAKRQMTWFRRDEEVRWFCPENSTEILNFIKCALNASYL